MKDSEPGAPPPRFGPIPAAGFDLSDLAQIPEYVSVLGKDGNVAGYVRREDLFLRRFTDAPRSPEEAVARSGQPEVIVVYDQQERAIGRWISEVGFVPDE